MDDARDIGGEMLRAVIEVVEGRPSLEPGERLDALIRWLSESDSPRAQAIRPELIRRRIDPAWVRRMALMLLEETLFARPDAPPEALLGLGRGAPPAELRERYHALMRVYHPDRGDGRPEWLHERSTRLNEAYRRARSERSDAASIREPDAIRVRQVRPTRSRWKAQRRYLRRKLGTPHALRRRVLVGLVAAGAAAVAHTFVVHRAWERWQGEGAPGSQLEESVR